MTLPNLDQNQNPDQNPPQNQPDSNPQGSQQNSPPASSTPSAVYDPRVDSLVNQIDQLTRMNQAIFDKLNTPPAPPPAQAPSFTEDDMRERPAEVISTLVNHGVNSAVDKLRKDITSQLTPVNEFIGRTQRQTLADQIIGQLKGNPAFSRLSEPNIEQAFRSSLSGYTGNIDINSMTNLYIYSVGMASVVPVQNPPNNPNQNSDPAHLRPDPSPNRNQNTFQGLPPLTENEAKLARQNGWSHARACYAWQKISWEQYQKIEPTGKRIEGI